MNKKRIGWKRVGECQFCGQSRCMVNVDNEKMGYCFRLGKTFFITKEGKCNFSLDEQSKINRKRGKKKTFSNQKTFDFGEDLRSDTFEH